VDSDDESWWWTRRRVAALIILLELGACHARYFWRRNPRQGWGGREAAEEVTHHPSPSPSCPYPSLTAILQMQMRKTESVSAK
jgi:hypothetical protein